MIADRNPSNQSASGNHALAQAKYRQAAVEVPPALDVVDDRTPQERAHDLLTSMANEDEDVKAFVMQEIVGQEDFQNAQTQRPG